MSSYKFSELREKLLPQNRDPWRGNVGPFLGDQSTSRSLPDFHFLPPLTELHEPGSVEKQEEYLTGLTEKLTDGYLQVDPGQNTQSSLFFHQQESILDAITSGQEFPGSSSSTSVNSSSGFVDSNSEMLSSSSMLSFGDISVTPGIGTEISGCLEPATSLSNPFRHSQQPLVTNVEIGSVTSHRHRETPEATRDMGSSTHEGSDLVGVTPFDSGTEIDIHQYMFHDLEVIFPNLENHVFEKQQSRKDKQARQRIVNGKVKFLIRSDHPVKDVRVWVRRELKAAQLEGDTNGMVPIETVFLRKNADNNLEYQVDLDSVYEIAGSSRPVYKLAKVHTQERNQFELLVQVVYADNQASEQIASKPFLIKTKRMNDESAEPAMYSQEKRKRPNTCPSSSSRWSPQGKHRATHATQHTMQNEPDSTGSMSPLSSSSLGSRNSSFSSEGASQLDQLVVKHLKAQQANIDKLSFGCMMQTSKGDIAYHLRLTNPDTYHNHEEGVVVGFFPDDEGMATIEPLTNENAPQAVMAGVISRSAYLEAHAPLDTEKGQTDIVCVIGMVKVQIVGSVRTGERIYASTENPGTGTPESHLPLGAFIIRHHTLLGMAMETCKSRRYGEVNLVKCFVCIVLGINSNQLASEVENILESIDMDIKVAIGKSNKTTCRRMSLLIVGLVLFLGVFGFFVYQLLTPGSLFRYYLCRIGSCSDHHLKCNFTSIEEELVVPFIQFDFDNLKEKIPHGIIPPEKMNSTTDSALYFLNYDRCAYGGRTDGIKYTLEKGKIVRGPTFLASDGNCSEQFIFENKYWNKLNWIKTHPNETLRCACSDAGDSVIHQWIALLLSFAMTCFIKDLF